MKVRRLCRAISLVLPSVGVLVFTGCSYPSNIQMPDDTVMIGGVLISGAVDAGTGVLDMSFHNADDNEAVFFIGGCDIRLFVFSRRPPELARFDSLEGGCDDYGARYALGPGEVLTIQRRVADPGRLVEFLGAEWFAVAVVNPRDHEDVRVRVGIGT